MPRIGEVRIAGERTVDDWNTFRAELLTGGGADSWQAAFNDYYLDRLNRRYLQPIKILQEKGNKTGEGFSIVAIQCSLIEFLESTVQGKTYKYLPPERHLPPERRQQLGPHEYDNSEQLFWDFLGRREPFRRHFAGTLPREFYKSVRCPLLHEARTENSWIIKAKCANGDTIVETSMPRILYRDNFQNALLKFIEWYHQAILSDVQVQQAFIRKFDSLCS